MPEFGTLQGLAVDFQSNERINDLYRQETALQRAKGIAEAKASLYANDIKYQNAMNRFDAPRVKQRNTKAIYELGEWKRNNPDWSYNPTKRAEYDVKLQDLKSNEDVLRGVASDNAFKAMTTDLQELAKSGKHYNKKAYDGYLQQKRDYEQWGNQNGYDAAQSEGLQPFVYIKPKEFIDDLAGDLLKAGDGIQDYNVIKPKDGNIGEWYSEAKPEAVGAVKRMKYEQHGAQLQQLAEENGWNESQLDKYVTDNIAAGIKKNYSIGNANAKFDNMMRSAEFGLQKKKLQGELMSNPSYTPFDYVIDPRNQVGQLNGDDIKKVWGDKPVNPVYGNSGSKVDLSDFSINYNGKYVKNKGIPFFMGTINLPLNVAEERGIYKQGVFTKDGITAEFLDNARVKKGVDKDGKETEYVEVDYNLPINPNDKVARDKFNVFVLPDKLVSEGANPFQGRTYQGHTVGSVVNTTQGNFLVTENGYVPQ
jgi:hypothetical protein